MNINFLNVDLDIQSEQNISLILNELGENIVILHHEEQENYYFARLEINSDTANAEWNIFYNLIAKCAWMFIYEKTAIVSESPIKINLDRDNNEHGQKEAIIEFSDRFKIYDNY